MASTELAGNGCPIFNRFTTNEPSFAILPLMATRIVLPEVVVSLGLSADADAASTATLVETGDVAATGAGA